ncbi:MAG: flagellar basal body-associated FliL family protein [Phycisphaerae bacterium]
MAEDIENQDSAPLPQGDGGGRKMPIWLGLCVLIVAVASAAGYGVGQFISTAPAAENEPGGSIEETEPDDMDEDYGYRDFETITVNFDEPRMARYVRATVTFAIPRDYYNEAVATIEQHAPELRDWLTTYLAGCTLDDLRGPKNLNRIRRDIEDAFNRRLWPDSKPRIANVLFKEFFVQ